MGQTVVVSIRRRCPFRRTFSDPFMGPVSSPTHQAEIHL